MFRSDDAARPALIEAVAPATGTRDAKHDFLDLEAGARLLARVEAQLAGGTFRVRVAGALVEMKLPVGIVPDTTLDLIFVGARPRPTFVLLNPPVNGSSTVLSPTARWVSALLSEAKTEPLPISRFRAAPVLDQAPADRAEFSARLQHAFVHSGLFYESHQAQWVAGKRSLEQLMQEPQGRLSTMRATPDAGASSSAAARFESSAPPAPDALDQTIHKDAEPLVKQQLAALDGGHLAWRGEVWPGQALEWQITGEPLEQDDTRGELPWRSELKLVLPQLDAVSAVLVLDTRGVRITLHVATEAVADTLRAGEAALVQAMQEAGLNVTAIEVRHYGRE